MHASQTTQRRLLVAFTFFLTLLVAGSAFADRVVWKKTTLQESNESWRIDLEFHLSKSPDIAHIPMRFEFENTVYYERTLVDGKEGPVERMVPLEFKQPLIESVDVGFLDPGTGKTQPRTRFSFKLTREVGFEAGEYMVQVTNKRSGNKLGGKQRLILKGENEVIDRRSMVFDGNSGKKKKEKKEEKPVETEPEGPSPNSDEYWSGGEPDAQGEALPPPAHMRDNPGACGCRVPAGHGTPAKGGLTLLLALIAAPLVRRRRLSRLAAL